MIGFGMGVMFLAMFCTYGLGFWLGSNCIEDTPTCPSSLNDGKTYTAADVLTIFYCVMIAEFNLT